MGAKVNVDIIILSYAKTDELKNLTIQSVETLLASESQEKIKFNVLVIESNNALQPYQFANTTTIYPAEDFGFNKYLNIGIKQTNSPCICLCNNDIIFHKGWASEILIAMDEDEALLSANPYCTVFHAKEGFEKETSPIEGYFGVLGGWCIFVKREIFDIIGLFDEKFNFWYADSDYCQTLIKYGVKNCLIPKSIITHLGSVSLNTLNKKENQEFTQMPRFYYSYKWIHHSWFKFKVQVILHKLKMIFNG